MSEAIRQRIIVWDGTLPARCTICGGSLGTTLKTVMVHCQRLHPGTLEAILEPTGAGTAEAGK